MQILDGKATSEKILSNLKSELEKFPNKPTLDIILVGDNEASLKYVEMKQKKAENIGIKGQIHRLSKDSTTEDVLKKVQELNNNGEVTAFMIQLPLPKQIDTQIILKSVDPQKDADGLNPINLGLLFAKDKNARASATALGVIKLLDEYQIDLSGKNAVIVGRSLEVGLPLFSLLISRNATVTICHSYTQNLENITRGADILISAIGKGGFVTNNYIKPGAVVIDVGLSLDEKTGKLIGDVDFDSASKIAKYITPVPGGTGPMTIASLLSNTVEIWKRQNM